MSVTSLEALGQEQLELARQASSGRSARSVYGGREHTIKHTLIALCAGHGLSEHANPGEATVHVLSGRVRLTAGDSVWDGQSGQLIVVPQETHSLHALEDSVVLLTTASRHQDEKQHE